VSLKIWKRSEYGWQEKISEMDRGTLRLSTQHREQFAGAEARTRESEANVQHNLSTQRENCAISWQGARQCAKSWAATINTGVHVDTRQHQVARQSQIVTIKFGVF